MKALVSLRELAHILEFPLSVLRAYATNSHSHYHVWEEFNEVKKKSRTYEAPVDELKEIQRRIVARILGGYELEPAVHGAVKDHSPGTNARAHLGQPVVVNLDVIKFFREVGYRQVHRMFRQDFGYGKHVSWLLTKLVTLSGRLPTGAPTSPAVANALLTRSVDRRIAAKARELGVSYTRYVDDMTFSGQNARALINEASVALSGLGLRVWRKQKLKIRRSFAQQTVTGLVVNSRRGPSVSRKRRDKIRGAIHQLRNMSEPERAQAVPSIEGKINYVAQFNPGAARRMRQQLAAELTPT